jgi:hypothetical protein
MFSIFRKSLLRIAASVLLSVAALSLLSGHAEAAIARVETQGNFNGTTTPAFSTAFAVGDVIIVFGNYFPTASSPGATDSLGNVYTVLHNSGALYTAGPEVILKTVVTVAGAAPTVSITGTNASRLVAVHYNGFVGTPTFLTGTDFVEATGTGTAVSTSTFTVSHAGELLVGLSSDTGGTTQPNPADLSFTGVNSQIGAYDSTVDHPSGLTAGATVGWSTTLSASDTWYVAILGVFDATSAGTVVFNQAGFSPIISTVSTLPVCNAGLKGTTAMVSDATSPTYNAALTGGGTVSVPVYCNGSNWSAH